MSARRQARAAQTATAVQTLGGIPRCLAIGPCLEVWADGDVIDIGEDFAVSITRDVAVLGGARRRYGSARRHWVEGSGMDPRKSWAILPARRAWSITETNETAARLRAIGCTLADLPALADEADELHRRATLDDSRKAPTS
ncbi:hypothetical protein ABT304_21050 [Nocardioides sp. NPDC000445]|uniref:hypothetical protein n=1 Tax=Nocardioides sp. NPDC000445 TaxID=3154257 RepID=UPI003326BA3B